ncbi:MAG: hypothetical protein HQL88_06720 [Magnetococcales bacterium]|nr:hypothetical protein [Magnetococcales bacterium]
MGMAMAMDVATRLWLGGVVNVQRNKGLILSLAQNDSFHDRRLQREILEWAGFMITGLDDPI